MVQNKLTEGTVHTIPPDLKKVLLSDESATSLWNNLTPLGRNEFICWVENAKAADTRTRRIKRTIEELLEGKRRPCCWYGCVHRPDKNLSKTQEWILKR